MKKLLMGKLKDLFNTTKYRRRVNKFENNYYSVLEEVNTYKDKIISLQNDKIALLEGYNKLKTELKQLKKETRNNEKR